MQYKVGDKVRLNKNAVLSISEWEIGDEGVIDEVVPYSHLNLSDSYYVRDDIHEVRFYGDAEEFDLIAPETEDDIFERQLNEVRRGIPASEVHA